MYMEIDANGNSNNKSEFNKKPDYAQIALKERGERRKKDANNNGEAKGAKK
jgi:hypothetical protein